MSGRRCPGRRGGVGRRQVFALAALLGAVVTPGVGTAGHGGVVQVSRAPAGPYTLSVWTQPTPPRAGAWQVDVAVMREGGAPVGDAEVRVRAEPLAGEARPVEVTAAREADPLGVRYRAHLALGAAGPWRVTLSVAGPAGPGALAFPIDVEPASPAWWPAIALAAAGITLLATVFLTRRGRRAAGLALLLLCASTPAWPHASLVRSSPARRATLTTAPDRVQLWFSEAIEPRFSSVSVWDAAGRQVDFQDARVEPEDLTRLTVGLAPLRAGTYRVRYRVLSVDGHVVEGDFLFTLRP